MSNDKTDAEFIAECEAAIANDGQIGTYQGIPVIMTGGTYDLMKEAVERLKRCVIYRTETQEWVERAERWHQSSKDAQKEIAELKALLRYAAEWGKSGSYPDETAPQWVRIDEILKDADR